MGSPLVLSLKRRKNLYNSTIKLLSPAKLNLYLNILGSYSGGFHRIESIVERISLCDEITIRTTKEPKIKIHSNIKDLESATNLVVKAATLIKKEAKLPFGFDIFLKKRIPVGAGLGGGSSNAASTLIGINTLLRLGFDNEKLYKLGGRLGSDVNFFLSQSKFALLQGRGEKVVPFEGKNIKHFVIWPKISLSTKTVYNNAKVKLTKFFNGAKILQYAIKKGDRPFLQKRIFNVLEKTAIALCKELKEIKKTLSENDLSCHVTGSGSALYTVGSDISINAIKSMLPSKMTVFAVKTF